MCGHNIYSHKAELIKFDRFGQIIWSKNFPTGIDEMRLNSIKVSNQIYLAGSIRDTAFVMAIDTNANTLWTKMFAVTGYHSGSVLKMESDSNGIYILTGLTDSVNGTNYSCLSRMNLNGALLWNRVLPLNTSSADLTYNHLSNRLGVLTISGGSSELTLIDSSGIIISCRQFTYQCCNIISSFDSGFFISHFYQNKPFVTRTDADGNPLWTKLYNDSSNWLAPQGSLLILDSFLYFGVRNTNYEAEIVKTDANGNVVWFKDYSSYLSNGLLQAILRAANGNIWINGTHSGVYDEYFLGLDDTTSSISCFATSDLITDSLVPTLDSILYINLQSVSASTISSNEILTPCTLNQHYECTTGVFDTISRPSVQVYPNPASLFSSFTYTTQSDDQLKLKVWTLQGVLINEFELDKSGTYKLVTSQYEPGVYIWTIETDNTIIATDRLVIIPQR